MDILLKGIAAGIMGTIFMDVLNHLSARTGVIIKIEMSAMILKTKQNTRPLTNRLSIP